MNKVMISAIAIILSIGLVACASNPGSEMKMADDMAADRPSIAEIAVDDGRFTTLVAALDAAGLVDTLAGDGSFTVFAPTDDAFGKLPAGTVESLLENIPALTDILLYHVVSGEVYAETVVTLDGEMVETLSGDSVEIKVDMGSVYINDAKVIITDIAASNGVIHVVDTVILPAM